MSTLTKTHIISPCNVLCTITFVTSWTMPYEVRETLISLWMQFKIGQQSYMYYYIKSFCRWIICRWLEEKLSFVFPVTDRKILLLGKSVLYHIPSLPSGRGREKVMPLLGYTLFTMLSLSDIWHYVYLCVFRDYFLLWEKWGFPQHHLSKSINLVKHLWWKPDVMFIIKKHPKSLLSCWADSIKNILPFLFMSKFCIIFYLNMSLKIQVALICTVGSVL